jgi:hypothetical protein
LGFWTEHRKLWCEEEWFSITSRDNEKVLSRVLDRYIMRQKIMLDLTINKDFQNQLEFTKILVIGIKLHGSDWPEDSQAVHEQDQIEPSVPEVDEVAPPSETEATKWWEIYHRRLRGHYEGKAVRDL